ncbi:MAG: acyltransferase, partial [Terriglobia bacterium]
MKPLVLLNYVKLGRGITFAVPLRFDGKGKVVIGDNTTIGYPLAPKAGNGEALIQARSETSIIEIGEHVALSNNVSLIAMSRITIGDECLIGDFALIIDSDFHEVDPVTRRVSPGQSAPVSIGKNVWLGSRVIVQKGVTIGDNSV